jgi:hypothetical protein
VTYYTQDHYSPKTDLVPFFNGRTTIAPLEYTKIKITAPSDQFTEDLWIEASPPPDLVFKQTYMQVSAAVSVVVYILFSMIASLAAGMLVFRKKTAGAKMLLLHGLWNCATFIGMALATKKIFPQNEYGKRGPYILAFYLVFAGLLSVYAVVLSPSLAITVLIGWVIGLLSPVLSLGLLFIPLMSLSIVFSMDAASAMVTVVTSIIMFILALCPVPVLIWLKRWLDPEPVPVHGQDQDPP